MLAFAFHTHGVHRCHRSDPVPQGWCAGSVWCRRRAVRYVAAQIAVLRPVASHIHRSRAAAIDHRPRAPGSSAGSVTAITEMESNLLSEDNEDLTGLHIWSSGAQPPITTPSA